MRKLTTGTKFSALRRAVLAAMLTTLSSSPVMLPQTAAALPKSCIIRSYYNNAELDTQVGMRSSCPGARKWGKVTRFVEVERVDLVPEGPGGGTGGGLPCEFQQGQTEECNNLPRPRP